MEHPDTLTSICNFALILQYQQKYEAAKEMNQCALNRRLKLLGKEHPGTLTSMDNLAKILRDQERYEEAENMDQEVLEGSEKVLGRSILIYLPR